MTNSTGTKLLVPLLLVLLCLLCSGCSWFTAQAKPDPQNNSNEPQELTYLEKVKRPPPIYFDLEAEIEDLFKAINKLDFSKAQIEYQQVQTTWAKAKSQSGNIKGVKETDEALIALGSALSSRKGPESIASLNKFTNNLGTLLMSYKLSPLSDVVNLATISRNIAWELAERDFKTAQLRTDELKKTWEATKVNFEQPGILSEITKAHDTIGKIKNTVAAENQMASEEQLKKFNEGLTKIRDFYKGKSTSKMP